MAVELEYAHDRVGVQVKLSQSKLEGLEVFLASDIGKMSRGTKEASRRSTGKPNSRCTSAASDDVPTR